MNTLEGVQASVYAEDLVDLARYAFRVAQDNCIECRDHHALWTYERLAEVKGNSFETDRDILGPLLRDRVPLGARVMIAGAADAGLLALVVQEAHSRAPRVTVVDRCSTPLAVCRRYAESKGLSIATLQKDLTIEPTEFGHRLIFAHNILMHLSLPLWDRFLQNLCLSLDEGGVLLLVYRERPFKEINYPRLSPADYAERALAALSASQITLPEAADPFRHRFEDFIRSKRDWPEPMVTLEELEARLSRAGFKIAQRAAHSRRITLPPAGAGEAKPITTHILLAERA